MAEIKITELDTITEDQLAPSDVFLVDDISAPASKKIEVSELDTRYTEDITLKGSTSDDSANALLVTDSSDKELFKVQNDGKIYLNEVNLSDTVWDDVSIQLVSQAGKDASAPGLETFRGSLVGYAFDDDSTEELFFSFEMPHGWKTGSALQFHIHYACNTTNTGNAVIGLEISGASINGVFPVPITQTATVPVDGTQYKQYVAGIIDDFDASALGLSTHFIGRVFRSGADVADTLTGDLFLLTVGVHHEINSLGSRNEYTD